MSESSQNSAGAGPTQRSAEIGVALVMAVLAVIGIIGSLQAGIDWAAEGPRAGFFPFYVSVIVLICCGVNLAHAIRIQRTVIFAEWPQLHQVFAVVVPATIFVFAVPVLGMYVSSALLIGVFMKWLGRYRWLSVIAIAAAVPILTYIMFERWFMVPLPKGPVENWLGL